MLTRIALIAGLAAGTLAISACSLTGNILDATIDGTPWSAINATVTNTGETMGVSTRVITGTNISETMTLTMVGIDGPGNWDIGSGEAPSANLHFNINAVDIDTEWDCANNDDTPAGTLVIDTLDDNGASGTFSCTARDDADNTIEVTNGVFDVSWGTSLPGIPGGV